MIAVKNSWHPVAHAVDLPMRHVFHGELHGVELALWRADDGRVNAWENRCPHRSVRLTLGVNTGGQLRCQYHGWQYRSDDGRCTVIPASSHMAPPNSLCARPFATAEADGFVWVSLFDEHVGTEAIPRVTRLPVSLRCMPINAPLTDVKAGLMECTEYDRTTTAAGDRDEHDGNGIALALRSSGGVSNVHFWLQPANGNRTIVHGSAEPGGMTEIEVQRTHNRLLNQLRARIENRIASISGSSHTAPVRQPAIIPVIPVRSSASFNHALFQATVTRRWTAAQDIVAFSLAPPAGRPIAFDAGAHIDVCTPSGLTRQYSLVNTPDERDQFVIGVKLEPSSRGGSQSLHDSVRVGDVLTVSAPKNHFRLIQGKGGILIAGGIGITPILAMGSALQHAHLRYALHYFARGDEHIAFRDRLSNLSSAHIHTGLDVDGTRNAVDVALSKATPGADIYVCGPRPLIDLVRERAACNDALGLKVHFELFANQVSHSTDKAFKVRLRRSAMEFTVPAGVTLADALKARGIPTSTSCEQGVCGTCRTAVCDGEPDHRDVYLSDQERNSGTCLMPCVSRSRSELLVLDL
ncbi:Rieske 2Fe-2S domain-containing protein [Paraburkholderia sp. ZP32-5]|uniref:Rieske 2Fe-2S domain-containing protein n=1 Tax=Paraburkholderia sp. ZP32-5 TaxID=2883245 RepID=UPI001F2B8EFC|nr:Rieske 2Fe-2S domain-containing protein [Paraburkholderia sp. ZP32-5]